MSDISSEAGIDDATHESYQQELRDILQPHADDAQEKDSDAASVSTARPSLSSPPPVIRLTREDATVSNGDAVSVRSLSTADETISAQLTPSLGSTVESQDSLASSSTHAATRKYLSPLRSKRYDGLRSSLSPATGTPRPGHFQPHSRSSSVASMLHLAEMAEDGNVPKPREAVKWTPLRKMSSQLYSEAGKRAFGIPTCFTVSGVLAIGTTKGLVLIFDYKQSCQATLGNSSLAPESGPVTAIALSADHTFLATGHENGSIFLWDLQRTAAPVKHISAIATNEIISKSGHLYGTTITQISFVGSRNSTLLSGDNRGMVFNHHINKRLLLGRVDVTRILGRHPSSTSTERMKPSSIWFSAALPLGSMAHYTDSLGLAAILTPHKLVVVTTFPIARTQFKLNRPTGSLAEASEFSGCAAWYPSVQASQHNSPNQARVVGTRPMLAVAWSRHLLVLTINEPESKAARPGTESLPLLSINVSKQYTCDETIIALQWYSHEILSLLTQSRRCLMLDVFDLHLVAQCDLLSTHIIHRDIDSSHLRPYFEDRESEYVNQTFSDDYSQSFHLYKGKFFLLGAQHLSIGTMLSWGDRVMALLSDNRHLEAIELLVAYRDGSTEIRGLGLPSDVQQRKAKMSDKLKEIILSTAKYATNSEELSVRSDHYHTKFLEICFDAMLPLQESQFLFQDVYEIYEEVDYLVPYLNILAKHILNDRLSDIPPNIVQALIQYFASEDMYTRMEDLICHLQPHSLDANLILQLAFQHHLYNALAYTMTEVLLDFVAPVVEFFKLVKSVLRTIHDGSEKLSLEETRHLNSNTVNAVKVFSYLSMTLTGRVFPRASTRAAESSDLAKVCIYEFLFSGTNAVWPPESGKWLLSELDVPEPTFPYLRLLLSFDCPTFLACMDEAFEDSFLNDNRPSTMKVGEASRKSITRQFITNILLEVMSTGFDEDDLLYLYMFIARNVPKYPQYILLSGSVLEKVILGLCQNNDPEVADDCQLSVEYILSVYKPANSMQMLVNYENAGFHRVLQSIYRAEHQWVALLKAHLKSSQGGNDIFTCITELLNPASKLSSRERNEVVSMVSENIVAIASLDGTRTADVVEQCLPQMHKHIFEKLLDREGLLYIYLRRLMDSKTSDQQWMESEVLEKYIDLLCIYDKQRIPSYLKTLDLCKINIDKVIEILEKYEAIESIATLLSVQGKRSAALVRVLKLLDKISSSLYTNSETDSVFDIITLQTYAIVATDLCADETADSKSHQSPNESSNDQGELNTASQMWIDLLLCLHTVFVNSFKQETIPRKQRRKLSLIYQEVFQKLLVYTARPVGQPFVRILEVFLRRITCTPHDLSEIKELMNEACSFHQLEFSLLQLADRILQRSLFHDFEQKIRVNNRGLKFDLETCVLCGKINSSEERGLVLRERKPPNARLHQHRRAERLADIKQRHGLKNKTSEGKKAQSMLQQDEIGQDFVCNNNGAATNGARFIIFHACSHFVHGDCLKLWQHDNDIEAICCPLGCSRIAGQTVSMPEAPGPHGLSKDD